MVLLPALAIPIKHRLASKLGGLATSLVVSSSKGTHDFQSDLSLSADGSTLAGGSSGHDSSATGINGFREDASAIDAGAVYLY